MAYSTSSSPSGRSAKYLLATAPLFLALTLPVQAAHPPQPPPPPPPPTLQQWAAAQLTAGHPIDLAAYPCPPATPTPTPTPPTPDPACRTLPGAFTAQLLSGAIVPPAAWPLGGLQLRNAFIAGPLDLTAAHIPARIVLHNTRLEGPVLLNDARFDNSLLLECDQFDDTLQGAGLRIDGSLSLIGSQFARGVSLIGATVTGFVRAGSRLAQKLDLGNAHVGLTLSFGPMLPAPCTGGTADISAGQGIALDAAEIGGNLQLSGAIGHIGPHDAISANAAKIHGSIGLIVTADGGIDLQHSTTDNSVNFRGSSFTGPLRLAGAHIANDLVLGGARFAAPIDLRGAAIGQNLDLRGGLQTPSATPLPIDLENARAGRLGDNQASWANTAHHVAGFVYAALVPPDPKDRPDQRWRRQWLAADDAEASLFDPQPYQQLAAVLTASGDKQKATQIAFWSRQREREMAWVHGRVWQYIGLSILAFTVGYGIGNYTFVVLIWVVLITAAGAWALGFSPKAREKGWLWRCQCGLDRLLPVIQLSPEFEHFFEDSQKSELNRYQVLFFSLVAIAGWLLTAFLAAALSGLTQGAS